MKLLIVNSVDPWTRSVATVHHYVEAGRTLGHEVLVYGEAKSELPRIPFTTDVIGVDLALFVIQVTWDVPEMPHLARLLDGVPYERRVVADLWGRLNDTVRVEHDFNHLEKLDGHPGVEWVEAIQALSGTVLQPTPIPLRNDVGSFLFHGFNEASVAKPYRSAEEAVAAWKAAGPAEKPYGWAYVGSNWQRWDQVRGFVEQYARARSEVGPGFLAGWDWGARPDWAVQNGIQGIDTDVALLSELGVEIADGVRFDEVVPLVGRARFAPVFHRPLFRQLGLVTNRTFETFYADAIPVLMLPRELVTAIYGPAALTLVPKADVAAHLVDALKRPEEQWDAVLRTRSHLALHHSYARRFEELSKLSQSRARSGEAR